MFSSKRADLLATEFERFGMGRPAAATLSSELMLRHPMVHRVGIPRLTRRLTRCGLDAENATHLALTLWGLERLMLGACFQDLLDVLRRAGVSEEEAFPACVDARRLWCATDRFEDPMELDIRLARWCGFALGGLVLAHLGLRLAV